MTMIRTDDDARARARRLAAQRLLDAHAAQLPATRVPAVRSTGRPPVSPEVPADDPVPGSSMPAPWSTALRSTSTQPPWQADLAQARHDAKQVLARIDFSQRDIVVVVPGTGDRALLPEQRRGIARAWPRGGASIAFIDYDTTWNMPRSMPQGMETLRQVLAGIARRGGTHRVFLVGQSQGALIIGEAMREPAVRAMVTRASILGHPMGVARTRYGVGTDPKVWHHTNPDDPIAQQINGSVRQALQGIGMLLGGRLLEAMPILLTQGPRNLTQAISTGIWAIRGQLRVPHWLVRDPHSYAEHYDAALAFVRDGAGRTADAVRGVRTIDDETRRRMVEAARRRFPFPLVRD